MNSESFLRWDPAQVSNYFKSILPDQDKPLSPAFLDHNIEGSLLPYMTCDHLKEIGFDTLATRLFVKKCISDLIQQQFQRGTPELLFDSQYQSSNHVTMDALHLSNILIKDAFKRANVVLQDQMSVYLLDQRNHKDNEIKRINDNFIKLKTDLFPVIRLLKDSKPLPIPTLDPNHPLNLPSNSPTSINSSGGSSFSLDDYNSNSILNANLPSSGGGGGGGSENNPQNKGAIAVGPSTATAYLGSSAPTSNSLSSQTVTTAQIYTSGSGSAIQPAKHSPGGAIVPQYVPVLSRNGSDPTAGTTMTNSNTLIGGGSNTPTSIATSSPTISNKRFSTASILSMGTGAKAVYQDLRTSRSRLKIVENPTQLSSPLVVSTGGSTGGSGGLNIHLNGLATSTVINVNGGGVSSTSGHRPLLKKFGSSGLNTSLTGSSGMASPVVTTPVSSTASSAVNEPLKQLRALSEDSCLKILQQATKRHHIPREDWSKYVLVICYGDRERILKLDEKPVIIFKELQEAGKHPAIMLRQLANIDAEADNYGDARLGEEIPGGTL
ncbi:Adaptor for signal transduction [Scheffersomyces spartinae]|uniref:Adaptor for signal transduction n=1 Tax=Scheffersomyces spartinae TaxID=45513 RepID=A0A9P7V839_9ASCO|nr:Adaptor for signal transduction [Scheffersomyces spartinae]KAG7193007.1 Adaptor for signal transduction [Scheffersomyces spartinae]